MSETGCVLTVFVVLAGILALYIAARVASEGAQATERQQRGERIHEAIRTAALHRTAAAFRELNSLLQGPRVGFVSSLEEWFQAAAPVLTQFLRQPQTASIVEWYFQCFSFPSGHMQNVLAWFSGLMDGVAPPPPASLQSLAPRVMREAGAAEAEWLYTRTLECLRERSGDLAFRALALQLGRISYAARRVDRRLTVYDEQAIANDIAICVK